MQGLVQQEELEAWLSLFDNPAGTLLKELLRDKAEYHLSQMVLELRAGRTEEAKICLAKHDVINKVLPDIRMRVQQLKGEIDGNNK